jgi:hypothetical protein
MIVVGGLAGGYEDEFLEVHHVVAGLLNLGEGLCERLICARWQVHLVGVYVHEPIRIQRARQFLLALEDLPPPVHPFAAGKSLDVEQPASEVPPGDLHGSVCGAVVYEVSLHTVREKMLQAPGDKAFLIIGGDYRDYAQQKLLPAALIQNAMLACCGAAIRGARCSSRALIEFGRILALGVRGSLWARTACPQHRVDGRQIVGEC